VIDPLRFFTSMGPLWGSVVAAGLLIALFLIFDQRDKVEAHRKDLRRVIKDVQWMLACLQRTPINASPLGLDTHLLQPYARARNLRRGAFIETLLGEFTDPEPARRATTHCVTASALAPLLGLMGTMSGMGASYRALGAVGDSIPSLAPFALPAAQAVNTTLAMVGAALVLQVCTHLVHSRPEELALRALLGDLHSELEHRDLACRGMVR